MKDLNRMISVGLRNEIIENEGEDLVLTELRELEAQMPDADVIEIRLYKFGSDDE